MHLMIFLCDVKSTQISAGRFAIAGGVTSSGCIVSRFDDTGILTNNDDFWGGP